MGTRGLRPFAPIGQAYQGGAAGGNRHMEFQSGLFLFPSADYHSVDAVIGKLCMGEMSAGSGGDGEVVFAVYPDAAHGVEYPLKHGSFGVMVQGGGLVPGSGALPVLPDGGGAVFGHGKPAGDFFVFQ